jgi:DNA-directed RNA polymerase subunit D
MKVTVLSKKQPLKLLIEGVDHSFINVVRSIILDEVETMAIEDVDFYENNSAMFDEYIAHRLGFVPLTTNLETYKSPSECCGGKCEKCSVTLTLESKGPTTVLAEEMKSKDPKIKPVYGGMPIVKLGKGQSLRFEAKAVLGKGKVHAKWQPGPVGYRYTYKIEADKDLANAEEVAKSCPKKVLSAKGGKLTLEKELECNGCGECAVKANKKVHVKPVKDSFILTLESKGSLSDSEIISRACEIGKALADEIGKALD